LARDVVAEGICGSSLEPAFVLQPGEKPAVILTRGDLAAECTDLYAQFSRSARSLASPERRESGCSGRAGDHDPVGVDRFDPPGRGTEHERFSHPAFEDELLIELAKPRSVIAEIHRILAGVRDSATSDERQASRARQRVQMVVHAVPAHSGPKVSETLC